MGNSISRSTRKLPTKPPAWSGARVPPAAHPEAFSPSAGKVPRASESKTEEINADGKDPHLLTNLSRIGPVDVKSAAGSLQTSASIRKSVEARKESELEALSSTRPPNRLLVTELVDLLADRKKTADPDMSKLAAKYGMDRHVFDSLVKYVNTPTAGESIVSRRLTEEGEQMMLTKAVWVERESSTPP